MCDRATGTHRRNDDHRFSKHRIRRTFFARRLDM
jgi:hypothetical protein